MNNIRAVDFDRKVYCVLGVPVDSSSMQDVLQHIAHSTKTKQRFFLSTPNLNFVMAAQSDLSFRKSLILSDLCPVDGMGALVICRLLGIPINTRVAGSDLPVAMAENAQALLGRPLRMALFGGDTGVAGKAQAIINARFPQQLECVDAIDPGLMTPEKMQDPATIARLNRCNADFLLVALGAAKGQAWILRNQDALTVPAISHLGATINFIAGTVNRAPRLVQKSGLEWLWRIKEEPKLASRYLSDGTMMAKLMLQRVLPLARWLKKSPQTADLSVANFTTSHDRVLGLSGSASGPQLHSLRKHIKEIDSNTKSISLDISNVVSFDMEFAGIVLLLEQYGLRNSVPIKIVGATGKTRWAMNASGLGHLLG